MFLSYRDLEDFDQAESYKKKVDEINVNFISLKNRENFEKQKRNFEKEIEEEKRGIKRESEKKIKEKEKRIKN